MGISRAVSFKEKIHGNSSKSGNKTPSVSKAESVLCQFCGKNNHSNLLPVVLTFVSQEEAKGSINVDALLDTGYLAGDFVARRIVDRFNIRPVINSAAKLSVCSGLDNTCYDISQSVIISVNYLNERVNKINTFTIKAICHDIGITLTA